eukprot:gb/GFBE01022437.1/.p1 GENE.gb/GFBE01022437.1/~~gb/GFBE01022437.1/.p1  ORF type:complete len:365 (+),score=106.07 gb/GFBE01022437.1/:1-1095(+)
MMQIGTIWSSTVAPGMMRHAIKHAKSIGFGKQELSAALAAYDKAERMHGLHRALVDVLYVKHSQTLWATIRRVEATGVTKKDSSIVVMYLEGLRRKAELMEQQAKLGFEMKGVLTQERGSAILRELPDMLKEAEELGMRASQPDLADASKALQHAQAQKQLEAALESGEIQALEESLAAAKEAGVEKELIQAGELALKEEQLLVFINEAVADFDQVRLETHLAAWREMGFDSDVLKKAEAHLAEFKEATAACQSEVNAVLKRAKNQIEFKEESHGRPDKTVKPSKDGHHVVVRLADILKRYPTVAALVNVKAMHPKTSQALVISDARAVAIKNELLALGCKNHISAKGTGSKNTKKEAVKIVCG